MCSYSVLKFFFLLLCIGICTRRQLVTSWYSRFNGCWWWTGISPERNVGPANPNISTVTRPVFSKMLKHDLLIWMSQLTIKCYIFIITWKINKLHVCRICMLYYFRAFPDIMHKIVSSHKLCGYWFKKLSFIL